MKLKVTYEGELSGEFVKSENFAAKPLIEAAPGLLEALQVLLQAIPEEIINPSNSKLQPAILMALSAIKKAEGE